MSFQSLVGNRIPQIIIQNGLREENLAHSLLFFGPTATGKLTTAYSIAKRLNCSANRETFCGKCDHCIQIDAFTHPDLFIINTDSVMQKIKLIESAFNENRSYLLFKKLSFFVHDLFYRYSNQLFNYRGSFKVNKKAQNALQEKINEQTIFLSHIKSEVQFQAQQNDFNSSLSSLIEVAETVNDALMLDNIPVETVRSIIKKLYIKPTIGKQKVFIFNGIELMKEEGANTFLKGIEEPPPHNTIILITEKIDVILPTIKSRCLLIPFHPLTMSEQKKIIDKEFGIAITDDAGENIHNLWDWFKKDLQRNQGQELVHTFFHDIAETYQRGNRLFDFADSMIKSKAIDLFFRSLFSYFQHAKRIKYRAEADNKNPFMNLADRTLDMLVEEGEKLLFGINKLNLNPTVALISYLIKVAKFFQLSNKIK